MDINILHLSDLHIGSSNELSGNLGKLLDDIEKQIKNVYKLAIVVTGDIIDKANYNTNSKKNVLTFFKRLQGIIGEKFETIVIVPGNHDKIKCNMSDIIINSLQNSNERISLDNKDWDYHLLGYKNFLELEDEIYSIFYNSGDKEQYPIHHINTYGVEQYNKSESIIFFIKIDTAWCSLGGENDRRKLRIFEEQLKELKNDYLKKKAEFNNKRILTIVICHHPLKWFKEEDEELLYSYFTNEEFLNVDLILCGHTHDIEINNMYSNYHQITTLLTGIGWEKTTPAEKREGHRYSIYIINLRRNSCEVIVRKTDKNGQYDIDREFLPDKRSKDIGKLSLPIISRNMHPYIEIPMCYNDNINYLPLFLDNNILNDIKKFSVHLSNIKSDMNENFYMHKQNFIDKSIIPNNMNEKEKNSILTQYFETMKDHSKVLEIFEIEENRKHNYSQFDNFLYEICNRFVKYFSDEFTLNEDLRLHFRFLSLKSLEREDIPKYVQICQQSKTSLIDKQDTTKNPRDIDYNSLIEMAHKFKTPLVFSSSPWYNKLTPQKWDNFITIVPFYANSDKIVTNDTFPYLTCGVSILSKTKTTFLDILNYIDIQNVINSLISAYVSSFKIDLEVYINMKEA